MLKLGIAIRDITPSRPAFLSGFAHRTHPTATILSRLALRVFAFEDSRTGARAAVITADLIGWDAAMAEEIERKAKEALDLSLIIFNASHTHSGPCVMRQGHAILISRDEEYLRLLHAWVLSALEEAFASPEEVSLVTATGFAPGLIINRRLPTPGGIKCQPNPGGPRDEIITVWRFDRYNGTPKALWMHAACHPTIHSDDAISGDFPGEVTRMMEEAWPGTLCAYLQGCAGDVRPGFQDQHGIFRRTDLADLKEFSAAFFDYAYAISRKPMTPLGDCALTVQRRIIHQELNSANQTISLVLSGLRLTENGALLAFPGEPSIFYQHFIKSLGRGAILPLGYCNGTPGYLPTDHQIVEGGYESVESCQYFGMAGPFKPGLEQRLCTEAVEMMDQLFSLEGSACILPAPKNS